MFISVHDPEAALGFYRDALGFEVRNDVKAGEFRWVTVGAPGRTSTSSCPSRTAGVRRRRAMPSCRS